MTFDAFDGEVSVLEYGEFGEYSFIIITLRTTLARSGNTCYGPIYESNWTV